LYVADSILGLAQFWENRIATILTDASRVAYVNFIFVLNKYVYVAGYLESQRKSICQILEKRNGSEVYRWNNERLY